MAGFSGDSATWVHLNCSDTTVETGVCGAVPQVVPTNVSVVLPASPGDVDPPSAQSNAVVATYQPPIPSLSVHARPSGGTADPTMHVNVTFSSPIANLSASDFHVVSNSLGFTTVLQGSGRDYTLTIESSVASYNNGCPLGYVQSPTGVFCAAVVDTPHTWEHANNACGPLGTLASIHSQDELEFYLSLTGGSKVW